MDEQAIFTILFPNNENQILLWTQIISLWAFISYYLTEEKIHNHDSRIEADEEDSNENEAPTADKTKSSKYKIIWRITFSLVAFFLSGFTFKDLWGRILLTILVIFFVTFNPIVHRIFTKHRSLNRFTAEWEIVVNLLFISISGIVIAKYALQVYVEYSLITFPIPVAHLSLFFLLMGAVLFLTTGGTRFTRGILEKTGTAPKTKNQENGNVATKPAKRGKAKDSEAIIDNKEYNRGKYIGNLERLLVLVVVLLGSYETIGFIIAGKGLIRAKEFEERDFAEYFLIGTLTSIFIAIIVGLLIKFAITKILGS